MRVYGYAAELLGLSPYWKRRPRLQRLMLVYEAFAGDGQIPSTSSRAKLSVSWEAIQAYFSQYLQARGLRKEVSGSFHFVLEVQAATNRQDFQAFLREGLADPNLAVLVVVCSSKADETPDDPALEPANPSLQLHRIVCDDSANPSSAGSRRQVFAALLSGLAGFLAAGQGVPGGGIRGGSVSAVQTLV